MLLVLKTSGVSGRDTLTQRNAFSVQEQAHSSIPEQPQPQHHLCSAALLQLSRFYFSSSQPHFPLFVCAFCFMP